jgi:SAM-dependent methyltransferase
MKQYDEAYFDRWYRQPRHQVSTRDDVARRVRLVVAAAEYALGRPLRSALDVGCGEAPWRAHLRRLRPRLEYVGVDSSEYVVRRFGRRRGIRHGTFGGLGGLGLGRRRFDLVICSDVLQYIPTAELRRGLTALRGLLLGVAYLDVFSTADDVRGDKDGWHDRSPRQYRRLFAAAGLRAVGLHLYLTERLAKERASLEMAE